jgi:hypothetical protein
MHAMGIKTYIPGIVKAVQVVCTYNRRWANKIRARLSGGQLTAYNALTVACDAFIAAMGEAEINP